MGAARNALLAANFTHNATLQGVVLQIQGAYFQYVANRALLQAQRTTDREARANLAAAEERNRVGVATIADVLQARTAASQAELAAQTTEGALQTSHGALALSLGLPANLPYEVDSAAAEVPVAVLADSVDTLIARAVEGRPDLAAAQAEFEASQAQISVARANRLPSLVLNGTGGRTYTTTLPQGGNNYTVSLGPSDPALRRLLPAVRSAAGVGAGGRGAGAGRRPGAAGRLRGVQLLLTPCRPRPGGSAPPRISSPARANPMRWRWAATGPV